jgi:hypothetical protein
LGRRGNRPRPQLDTVPRAQTDGLIRMAADNGGVTGRAFLSVGERMDELVRLREQELVTPDEFEEKRRELVANI